MAVILLIVSVALSGSATDYKEYKYGGMYDQNGRSVQQTSDGGYIVAGYTKPGFLPDSWKDYLIKIDAQGVEQWHKSYGGFGFEGGDSVSQTSDGGYIAVGGINVPGKGKQVHLVKTDKNGDPLWEKDYGGLLDEVGISVQQTLDGGYIIVGSNYLLSSGGAISTINQIYLLKTNSNGKEAWSKTFSGLGIAGGSSVRQTSDGGYIIAGSTYPPNGKFQIYLLKTDSNGKEAWSKTFSGLDIAEGSSVRQTSDGGYIVVGGTYPPGGKGQLYLLKTDSNGKETWSKTFSVLNEASGGSVQQTVDRGYIVAGYTRSSPYTSWQIYLIKTDENGILSWERKFEGLGFARGFSVRQTSDRGFIVAGETDRPLNGEKMKIYLVKLEPPYYYYYKQPSFANLVGSIDFNPSLLLMGRVNRSLKNR